MRRIAWIAGGLLAAWLAALVVLGLALGGRTGDRVASRVGESLRATSSTVAASSLALVRGRLSLSDLQVRRADSVGTLALDVADVRCELPALGGALFDRGCRDLGVSGVRLEVSTFAVFQILRPKRPPVRARRVIIDDATLAFSPSALLPHIGRVEIRIHHAEAGPTTFKTPLSWLLALRSLHATIQLPAGIHLQLTCAAGMLSVSGGPFGAVPLAIPFTPPARDPADDGRAEARKLVQLAVDLAERLVARRAQDWLRSKLSLP